MKKKTDYKKKGENKTSLRHKISLDQYLQKLSKFAGSDYGKLIREQFADNQGGSELAMLVSPTLPELEEFKKGVAIMTQQEKDAVLELTDEQVQKIASDAKIDPADFAIFINGFALHCKRVSGQPKNVRHEN